MTPPVGGIPVDLAWDDWKHLDSSFYGVIPGDSVKPGELGHFLLNWDWNTDDEDGPWSLGGEIVDPPPFHLVIVPVIWDSIPDYQIVEDTEGMTADSFKIVAVQQMLAGPPQLSGHGSRPVHDQTGPYELPRLGQAAPENRLDP